MTTDPINIARAFETFYAKLYKHEETKQIFQNDFLEFCKPISDEEQESLNDNFTIDEIEHAINCLNSDSSPGPDGLTSKFYKHFVKEISPFLEYFYKHIFINQTLPNSHKMSFITLIPKDSGSLLDIKNYRPISLLNTEYKILTSMLSKRLSIIMPTIIHTDQTSSIKSRNIAEHLHFIRDLITHSQITNSHNCILSIDQEKAFDRVSHDWLRKIICKYNFGDFFLGWFNILYTDVFFKIDYK